MEQEYLQKTVFFEPLEQAAPPFLHNKVEGSYTVICFVWVNAKFGTCTVVSVNGTLVVAKMCVFTLESTHFIFNKCLIYTPDGAIAKFITNSHRMDYSVGRRDGGSHFSYLSKRAWYILVHIYCCTVSNDHISALQRECNENSKQTFPENETVRSKIGRPIEGIQYINRSLHSNWFSYTFQTNYFYFVSKKPFLPLPIDNSTCRYVIKT